MAGLEGHGRGARIRPVVHDEVEVLGAEVKAIPEEHLVPPPSSDVPVVLDAPEVPVELLRNGLEMGLEVLMRRKVPIVAVEVVGDLEVALRLGRVRPLR